MQVSETSASDTKCESLPEEAQKHTAVAPSKEAKLKIYMDEREKYFRMLRSFFGENLHEADIYLSSEI